MKSLILSVMVSCLVIGSVFAGGSDSVDSIAYQSRISLSCETDEGERVADLLIDLEGKSMEWGITKYTITHVSSLYISAYEKDNTVGGEIWVINRITGEYKRSLIAMFCKSECSKDNEKMLLAKVYNGRCAKKLVY